MKKSLKRTCAVALALTATAGMAGVTNLVPNNQMMSAGRNAVYAENTEYTDGVLKISQYEKAVVLGDTFTMPTATINGSTAVTTYEVKTPSGKVMTSVGASFVVDEIGTYTITYTSGDYVGSVSFVSSVSTYNIALDTNNNKILPAKVGTDFSGDLYVPTYVVTDKNGKEISDANVNISVIAPDFTTLSVVDGKINYTTLVKGTYTVTYSVYDAKGNFLTKTEKTFKCVEGNAYEEDDELVLSYSAEKPESVNVGKTISLPKLTGKIGTEATPIYYTVEVFKNGETLVDADTQVGNTEKVVLKMEDGVYKFTANEIVDFYTIKYTAKTALDEKTAVTEFIIETVEDNLDPTPIVVDPYETNAIDGLKNVDYKLASNFNNKNIAILPIFAEDLGTFSFEDYTFKREIQNSNYDVIYTDTENPNKTIMFNLDGTLPANAIEAKNGETPITLADGTYTVYYTATDKSGNSETINYKFKVDAQFDGKDDSGDVKPVITFNDVFFNSVDKGEDITFGKVTFADDFDERLATKVYYQFQKENGDVVYTSDPLELNDDGKYVISTSDITADTAKVVIFAWAKNDSGFETEETQTIQINTESTGTTAPKVISVGTYTSTAVQGAEIVIPTIVFEDDVISGLNTEISIVCKSGEKTIAYDAYDAMAIRNQTAGTYTLAKASFVAATAGTYTVSVKATDAAGNVVIKFLTYTVTDASYTGRLRFTNIGLTDTKMELGDTFKLPVANIVGQSSDDYAYEVRCVAGPSGYSLNNDKFKPTKVGEYTLEYVMYLKSNPETTVDSETYSVKFTVEDSTNPEIYVNWKQTIVNDENATGEILGAYEKGTKLLLPKFSAADLSGINASKSMITITCSSSSTSRVIEFDKMAAEYDKGMSGNMYYTFAKDGEYTITYTVCDNAGNTNKQTFTVKVGDLEAPELEVSDDVIKSSYKLDDEITIDLTDDSKNYFEVSDLVDTAISKENIKVKLTVNGTEVKNAETENGKYKFVLADAGDYELTFTVKDSAGNESEVVKTFSIAEKAEGGMTQSETMLTVMIVISVVVLAGVVVYFVISKRKMDRLYK